MKQQLQKIDELITRFVSLASVYPDSNEYRSCLFRLRAQRMILITKGN